MKKTCHCAAALLLALNSHFSTVLAQGTAFTYQGQLQNNGSPANGSYDFAFTLFATNTGEVAIAGPVTNAAVAVTNGLFTTLVDFGAAYTGASNWLEVAVSTNSADSFTTLAPRQQLVPVPYAITAANFSGTIGVAQLPSAVVTNGASGVNITGNFSGSGSGLTNVPGTEPWQVVSGTAQTATSNEGYLLTNNAVDTVTLPTNANVGGLVTVSGTGSNEWLVAVGSGQSVAGQLQPAGETWTRLPGSPDLSWIAVAFSADGTHFIAAPDEVADMYTSTNSGETWMDQTSLPSGRWTSVGVSADGTEFVALPANESYIYVSTDAGGTWIQQTINAVEKFRFLAAAADGAHLVALGGDDSIYTSTNSGGTWTDQTSAPSEDWISAAESADGSHITAVQGGLGFLYTSTDSGATWSDQNNSPGAYWISVAESADGTHLVAVPNSGHIYISTNSGATWSDQNNSPDQSWISVAESADGTHLVAAPTSGHIYTSTNFGATWSDQNNSPADQSWLSVAESADGTHLVAVDVRGDIYTSQPEFIGTAGSTVQFQYQGNGVWQPVGESASQMVGTLTTAQLPSGVVTNNETGVTLNGMFSGDGSGLTGLSASALPSSVVTNNETGVTLNGTFSGSSVTLNNGPYLALNVQGSSSGGINSEIGLIQNNYASSGESAPALRVVGNGNTSNGALSVSAQGTGLIAQFGNSSAFVSSLDTNGNWTGNSFSGNGSGLTSLNAASLTGTIAAASLGATNTYTPTIGDGVNSFATSHAQGAYSKIGNRVFVEIWLVWTATNSAVSTNNLAVSLPFAVGVSPRAVFSPGYVSGISFGNQLTASASQGASTISFFNLSPTGAIPAFVKVGNCAASGELQLMGSFQEF